MICYVIFRGPPSSAHRKKTGHPKTWHRLVRYAASWAAAKAPHWSPKPFWTNTCLIFRSRSLPQERSTPPKSASWQRSIQTHPHPRRAISRSRTSRRRRLALSLRPPTMRTSMPIYHPRMRVRHPSSRRRQGRRKKRRAPWSRDRNFREL